MISFDEMETLLYEITDTFPPELFDGLNGGVILLEDIKTHAESVSRDPLYTLGEYHCDPMGLGRYVTVYYGSFTRVYPGLGIGKLKEKLTDVIKHELTHHWESLAGEKDLEIKDMRELYEYRKRKEN